LTRVKGRYPYHLYTPRDGPRRTRDVTLGSTPEPVNKECGHEFSVETTIW